VDYTRGIGLDARDSQCEVVIFFFAYVFVGCVRSGSSGDSAVRFGCRQSIPSSSIELGRTQAHRATRRLRPD
jgi:hypothetical protein